MYIVRIRIPKMIVKNVSLYIHNVNGEAIIEREMAAPPGQFIRVFHKLYENGSIGIFVFTAWKQKLLVTKCYLQWE